MIPYAAIGVQVVEALVSISPQIFEDPTAPVDDTPVGETVAFPVIVTDPTAVFITGRNSTAGTTMPALAITVPSAVVDAMPAGDTVTPAPREMLGEPTAVVEDTPVTEITSPVSAVAEPTTAEDEIPAGVIADDNVIVTEPRAVVDESPAGLVLTPVPTDTETDPRAVVDDKPVGDTEADAAAVAVPKLVVEAIPATSTCSMLEPYDPEFQVERPHPVKVGMLG